MFYREVGEFKNSYAADQVVFPIRQDRYFVWAVVLFAFIGVPYLANPYWFSAILIPFLILSLAALGLNLLVGYCGQISLGTGGFMAVGAYAAYNLALRVPGLNPLVAFLLAGGIATLVGVLFGIPSLRIKGFYLAVARSPRSFLSTGCSAASRGLRTHAVGLAQRAGNHAVRLHVRHAGAQIPAVPRVRDGVLRCSRGNLVRGRLGTFVDGDSRHGRRRRDHRYPPACAKLSAFAISSFFIGVAEACGLLSTWARGSRSHSTSTARSACCPWSLSGAGLHRRQLPGRGVHHAAAAVPEPVPRVAGATGRPR
jgi:branched-chain amino acid transport system permease protein